MKAPSAIAFAELACADHVRIAVDAKQEFGSARGNKASSGEGVLRSTSHLVAGSLFTSATRPLIRVDKADRCERDVPGQRDLLQVLGHVEVGLVERERLDDRRVLGEDLSRPEAPSSRCRLRPALSGSPASL